MKEQRRNPSTHLLSISWVAFQTTRTARVLRFAALISPLVFNGCSPAPLPEVEVEDAGVEWGILLGISSADFGTVKALTSDKAELRESDYTPLPDVDEWQDQSVAYLRIQFQSRHLAEAFVDSLAESALLQPDDQWGPHLYQQWWATIANRSDSEMYVSTWCRLRGVDGLIEFEERLGVYGGTIAAGHRATIRGPLSDLQMADFEPSPLNLPDNPVCADIRNVEFDFEPSENQDSSS